MFNVGQFLLDFLRVYFTDNIVLVIALIGMFFLLSSRSVIGKKDLSIFRVVLIILAFSSIIETIDYCLADPTIVDITQYPGTLTARLIFSIISFTLRPAITMSLFIAIANNRRWFYKWIWIPAALMTIVLLMDFVPGERFFYINEFNKDCWLPDYFFINVFLYIATYIYLLGVVITSIIKFKIRNFSEGIALLVVFILVAVGYIFEDAFSLNNLGNQGAAVGAFFIYVFYMIKYAALDPLTELPNRQTYYQEMTKNFKKITAVISIDMNGLKTLNDEYGHAKGDVALITIADGIKKSLIKGASAFRTGGDEFVILCQNMDFKQVDQIVDNIQEQINVRSDYNVAIGYSIKKEESQDAHRLLLEADRIMYQNKAAVKEEQQANKENNVD